MAPMMQLDHAGAVDLRRAVHAAVANPQSAEWFAEIDSIYRELADTVTLRRPVCRQSGKCCRFDEYGHLLLITTLELAWFRQAVGQERVTGGQPNGHDPAGGACPFQIGKVCSVHDIRPMGCRVFFCDAGTGDWQADLYERLHTRLRALHCSADVRYFCVEWRSALAALGLAGNAANGPLPRSQPGYIQASAGVGPRRIALTVCPVG